MAPQVGLEPTTLRLTAECSTIELLRSKVCVFIRTNGLTECQIAELWCHRPGPSWTCKSDGLEDQHRTVSDLINEGQPLHNPPQITMELPTDGNLTSD